MKKFVIASLAGLMAVTTISVPAKGATLSAAGDTSGLCQQTLDVTTNVTVSKSGTDCIIKFAPSTTSTWNLTNPNASNYRVLIVGGGGGGGGTIGAGGGAGGFIETTTPLSTPTITVVAGGGGAGGTANNDQAVSGSNSSISSNVTLTAIGGGRAAQWGSFPIAGSGGSGGGGAGTGQAGNSGTTGQGFAGGTSSYFGTKDSMATGGGGGASALGGSGTAGNSSIGGNGGDGKSSNISGTLTYYAGGGGGGTFTGTRGGSGGCLGTATGGLGGGGRAGYCSLSGSSAGEDGAANTGGGGGGASTYNASTVASGGKGGSGIVIIRYTLILLPTLGTPTISGTPMKGMPMTISITSDTPGRITFFLSGKKLGNCVAKLTTGTAGNYTSSCTWKPAVQGGFQLFAEIKPTDSNYQTVTSKSVRANVSPRKTLR